ncbi:purine-nucleoside phosphorylase [Sediminitomix flava]|uniref:Purine nucleoside phosphorylase n=1 Tax=Sediminitomix flava TaxID=379075 RepID=A0A316A215_SEDFL|nr:purine-nucleoside phosphorylase [Sediminitomix flava]PWJ43737.1 purine-nucleoside phosphorylase [Sediminitomix flava]
MEDILNKVNEAVNYIQAIDNSTPEVGIILGTGLGGLVNHIDIEHSIDYANIPHFPTSTVETHSGKLILGTLSGKKVIVMQGRFHYYEGYSMKEVTFPVRVMKFLGIQNLFISNAAGGMNKSFQKSDLMVIEDHINLCYENPLTGRNINEFGDRFPDMFEPYSKSFIELAHKVAKDNEIDLKEGVYVSVPGPNLETRAEYRFLSMIGADAVGMSTVPEVIVAVQMGLPVLAVSVITDLCYEGALHKVNIQDIIQAAAKAEPNLIQLFREILSQI